MNFTGNPIGVQLYTLRDECTKDFLATLETVAELGYGAVEFAGLYEKDAQAVRKVLDDNGLVAAGCHVSAKDFSAKFDEIKRDYIDILGCRYMTVPSGPREFNDGGATWNAFVREMRAAKAKCDSLNVHFAYHNHAFEFENKVGDVTAFDVMFHESPSESPLAEVDLCWVAAGRHDPVTELNRLKGRVKLVHVKDMDPGVPPKDANVGSGIIQWPSVYKAAEAAGVEWLIVERDKPGTPSFDSIKQSLEYLKVLGLEK